ncbi:MAG TPA: hypothetical protein VND91_03830 [Candidatus Saccharimonadia bacterium]|nr:hypothetical protein [Candidatus Saccharimonadia bacterium]
MTVTLWAPVTAQAIVKDVALATTGSLKVTWRSLLVSTLMAPLPGTVAVTVGAESAGGGAIGANTMLRNAVSEPAVAMDTGVPEMGALNAAVSVRVTIWFAEVAVVVPKSTAFPPTTDPVRPRSVDDAMLPRAVQFAPSKEYLSTPPVAAVSSATYSVSTPATVASRSRSTY